MVHFQQNTLFWVVMRLVSLPMIEMHAITRGYTVTGLLRGFSYPMWQKMPSQRFRSQAYAPVGTDQGFPQEQVLRVERGGNDSNMANLQDSKILKELWLLSDFVKWDFCLNRLTLRTCASDFVKDWTEDDVKLPLYIWGISCADKKLLNDDDQPRTLQYLSQMSKHTWSTMSLVKCFEKFLLFQHILGHGWTSEVPTYNETENLRPLCERLFAACKVFLGKRLKDHEKSGCAMGGHKWWCF